MTESPAAVWIISGDRLALESAGGRVVDVTAADVFAACFLGHQRVAEYGVTNPIDALRPMRFSRFPAEPILLVSQASSGAMNVSLGLEAGTEIVEPAPDGDQLITSAGWYPVNPNAIRDARTWLSERGINTQDRLALGGLIALRQATDAPFRLIENIQSAPALVAGPPSSEIQGLSATLYPYQEIGVSFLQAIADESIGCLLADEMGLGKTMQVIGLLCNERHAGRCPSVVAAPATLLTNWMRELAKFAPSLRVLVHAGPERSGVPAPFLEVDVVLVSYETLVRDETLFTQVRWNVLVLDEAQNIRNPDAQRTLSAKRIPRRVSIAVTGTPVENRLEDLWSISDFFLPGIMGDLGSFRGRFSNTMSDAANLAQIVGPAMLRRRVAEVAKDLPDRIDIPQGIEMSPDVVELYEQIRLDALSAGPGAHLAAATKLRELCAHPSLMFPWTNELEALPKWQRLIEILEEIFLCGEKALVFGSFQQLLDLLTESLASRWPAGFFRTIDGRTPVAERQNIIDAFSDNRGPGALVLNPKAAGVGLNITAANHVIHFTPEWNPAVTAQATARAYRRKQERPVTVHYLYYVGSVEEAIVIRAAHKQALADAATENTGTEADAGAILDALRRSPRTNA